MSRRYRLAILCDSLEVAGAERFLAHLMAALAPTVDIMVIARDAAVLEVLTRARPSAEGIVAPMDFVAGRRALRRFRPHVVHANLTALNGCRPLVLAALSLRLPVVLVDHLPGPGLTWRGRALQRLVTRGCAARVAVGTRTARMVERYAGLPDGVVQAIPNGLPRQSPMKARAADGRCVFGTLGRLEHQKGIDLLLHALAKVPDAQLTIMGSGRQREPLKVMVDDLGLSARVSFLPGSSNTDSFWRGIDVLVLPSRSEAMPLVLLEALQHGRPIIAADVGSVAEVLDENVGILVPAQDIVALAAALREMTDAPQARVKMGAIALERARVGWSADDMAAAYDALYRSVLRHP